MESVKSVGPHLSPVVGEQWVLHDVLLQHLPLPQLALWPALHGLRLRPLLEVTHGHTDRAATAGVLRHLRDKRGASVLLTITHCGHVSTAKVTAQSRVCASLVTSERPGTGTGTMSSRAVECASPSWARAGEKDPTWRGRRIQHPDTIPSD